MKIQTCLCGRGTGSIFSAGLCLYFCALQFQIIRISRRQWEVDALFHLRLFHSVQCLDPASACTRIADHGVPDSHKLTAVVDTFLTPLFSPFLKPMLSPFCRPAFHICPVCRASDIPEPFPSSDPPFSSLEAPPDLYPYAVIRNQARIAIADFRSIEFPQRFRTFPWLLSIV